MTKARNLQTIISSTRAMTDAEIDVKLGQLKVELEATEDPSEIRVIMSKVGALRQFKKLCYDLACIQLP